MSPRSQLSLSDPPNLSARQLRLCQALAARPRSHSSPCPSPLDQWPDRWLLQHRHEKQQLQQQQQQQRRRQLTRRRLRRRRRSVKPSRAAARACSPGLHGSLPRTDAAARPEQREAPAAGWDRAGSDGDAAGSDGDTGGSDGDAGESDEDADEESAASDAGGRYLSLIGAETGLGRTFGRLPGPDARDRLRRHGMVLMKGICGCQCAARKLT